jgi:hypothetical protein
VNDDLPQVTNLAQVDVEAVNAALVRMHQSSAQVIHAEDVELNQSAALEVNAGSVSARQSVLGFVQADVVTVQDGAVAAARAEKMSVNGNAGLVVAGSVEFGNTYAGSSRGEDRVAHPLIPQSGRQCYNCDGHARSIDRGVSRRVVCGDHVVVGPYVVRSKIS